MSFPIDRINFLRSEVDKINKDPFVSLGKIGKGQKIGLNRDNKIKLLSNSLLGKFKETFGTTKTLSLVGKRIESAKKSLEQIKKELSTAPINIRDLIPLKALEQELLLKQKVFQEAAKGLQNLNQTYQNEHNDEISYMLTYQEKLMKGLNSEVDELLGIVQKKLKTFESVTKYVETTSGKKSKQLMESSESSTEETSSSEPVKTTPPFSTASTQQTYIAREILSSEQTFTQTLVFSADRLQKMADLQQKYKGSPTPIFEEMKNLYRQAADVSTELEERLRKAVDPNPNIQEVGNIFQGGEIKLLAIVLSQIAASYDKLIEANEKFMSTSSKMKIEYDAYIQTISHESAVLLNETRFITAIQRVPRYQLLLQDLLSKTPPDSPAYIPVKQALEMIETLSIRFK